MYEKELNVDSQDIGRTAADPIVGREEVFKLLFDADGCRRRGEEVGPAADNKTELLLFPLPMCPTEGSGLPKRANAPSKSRYIIRRCGGQWSMR